MRILTLGLSDAGKSTIVNRLSNNETQETQPTKAFNITPIEFNNSRFQMWEVGGSDKSKTTFKQHTQNAAGIVFVIDTSSSNKFEEAQQYLQAVVQEDSLSGLPLLVYANKIDQGGNLQDIIEKLNLNFINDREWYIQGSEALSGLGINQGFDWLSKHILSSGNKSFSFEAQPKVVKSQAKYKQQGDSEPTSKSQMTFVNLMKDQKVIMMNPIQQENEYIKLEKERIKIENMHSQLKNFKKNKNKMTPYEIKPSPNPRIEVNLEFFLTDHNNLIVPQNNTTVTQTDAFQERPKTPPYVPKKTGIDVATQVEDFDLFDFDREVTPIVDVIVTKICEQSMLEIEQEEEILKMQKFKQEYHERRYQDKVKQKEVLDKEIQEIKDKNEKVKKYLDQEDLLTTTIQRTQSYGIAGQYLKKIQQNTLVSLFKSGFYPNNLDIKLKTEFIPWLVEGTCQEIKKQKEFKQKMIGLFDEQCINPIFEVKKPILAEREKKRQRIQLRRVNESDQFRYIRIFYKENKLQQSNFVRDFARFSDGSLEEYRRSYEAKVEELRNKIEVGDIQEEDYNKLLQEEFPEQTGWGFQVQKIKKLAFTLAHDIYYPTSQSAKKLSLMALCLNKDAQIVYKINKEQLRPESENKALNKFIRYKTNIRDPKRKIDNDEAIIVDFDKIPDDVSVIFILTKIPNIVSLAPVQQEQIAYSQIGVEDWKYNIQIDSTPISEVAKLEELVKPQDENQEEQTAYVFNYVLTQKGGEVDNKKWIIEQLKSTKSFYNPVPVQPQDQDENREQAKQEEQDQQQQTKDEFEEYIESIRDFWNKQDGNLKSKITNSSQVYGEENASQAEQDPQQESMDNSQIQILSQPRVTEVFQIELDSAFDTTLLLLEQKVEEYDAEFISLCTNGFDFFFQDKPLERNGQLKRVRNVQDLEVRTRPLPPPEPEVEDEEGNEDENPDEDQDE